MMGKARSKPNPGPESADASIGQRPNANSAFGQWLLLGAGLLILGSAIGWNLYSEHNLIDARERERLAIQAEIVHRNVEPQLLLANRVIDGILNSLPSWRAEKDGFKRANRELQVINDTLIGIRPILVINADGTVIASSNDTLVGRNFLKREYFQTALKNPDPGILHVSAPFETVLGTFVISLFRTMRGPNGEFAGIIIVSAVPEYFSTLLDSVRYASDMRTSIVHGDGKVFLVSPQGDRFENKDLANRGTFFTRHRESGQAASLFVGTVYSTGDERMVAQRTIQLNKPPMDKPLVVGVSRNLRSIFAAWRRDSYVQGGLFGVLALISVLSLYSYQKRRRAYSRSERERRASEEQLRAFYELDLVGLAITSPAKGWVRVNQCLCQMLESSEQELRGTTWAELTHPEDLAADVEQFNKLLTNEINGYSLEKRFISRTGKVISTNLVVRCVRKEAGDVDYVTAMVEDISERKQAELALQDSKEHFRKVVEESPLAMALVGTDGTIEYINRKAIEVFGYLPQDIPNMDRWWVQAYPDEAYRAQTLALWMGLVEGALAHNREIEPREYRVTCKNGSVKTVAIFGVWIGDKVLVIFEDVTVRRQTEEALRASHETLRSILETTLDGFWRLDANGNLLDINVAYCRQSGYTRNELIGRHVSSIDVAESAAQMEKHLQWIIENGSDLFESRHRRKDGSIWDVEISASYLDVEGGMFVSFLRDITERKQAKDILKASEEKYRALVETTNTGYLIVDREGRVIDANPEYVRQTGRRELRDILGKPVTEWTADYEKDRNLRAIAQCAKDGFVRNLVIDYADGNGRITSIEINATSVGDGDSVRIISLCRDVTERRQTEQQVYQLAFYDPLTKLPNRRLLNDRLTQAMAAHKRSGCYGALMFLDLDNFKLLNDGYGHELGDLLLIEAAERLKSCVREMDTVARFGGDEFVVMLIDLSADQAESAAHAAIVAEKIHGTLSAPYVMATRQEGRADITVEHRCTASIGVTLFIHHEANQDDILKRADRAMYRAKEAGRNSVRFYDPN
ncbi:MAG: PAS domain S-box protein [Sulfuritalea sp.]|jgi:diguanylate cyclase (GGDEF)-like protein/PAS domain S-box-containing protein|nr:PAS domain S-box protein [Sulfuritalea sp.]